MTYRILSLDGGGIRGLIYESPQLLIVAYDTIGRSPIVFKSWRQEEDYFKVPLWEACVCSASAPTFFPAHLLQTPNKRYSCIDGGIGANNPASSALQVYQP